MSPRSQMMFPVDVYTNCKQSVATTRSSHHRTMFLATLPELVMTQSPPAGLQMYGKVPTMAEKSVSNI